MPQVHTDTDRLTAFAVQLEIFANEVERELNRLSIALSRLGGTWQDGEYQEFQDNFFAAQRSVKKFIEEMRKITPDLISDAERLRPYFK